MRQYFFKGLSLTWSVILGVNDLFYNYHVYLSRYSVTKVVRAGHYIEWARATTEKRSLLL